MYDGESFDPRPSVPRVFVRTQIIYTHECTYYKYTGVRQTVSVSLGRKTQRAGWEMSTDCDIWRKTPRRRRRNVTPERAGGGPIRTVNKTASFVSGPVVGPARRVDRVITKLLDARIVYRIIMCVPTPFAAAALKGRPANNGYRAV